MPGEISPLSQNMFITDVHPLFGVAMSECLALRVSYLNEFIIIKNEFRLLFRSGVGLCLLV